ncbi:hypothetical protein P3T76_000492 [Phytophthora citrophthora]|uniref:Uncharacterized protein n=1 Tax=Phytophthora citrophthora TaxID=4793 RepID=A0AAD9LVD6_9STRA|nr:hypothetical protein P3T76_000492 [Phytophthora citrophthora]
MTTLQLFSSDRYADPVGLETYRSHTGQEFKVSKLVTGTPSDVFDAWIRHIWLAGGDQVHEGAGRGYIGSVRRVPLRVEEEILSAGLPGAKIPSISYRVRKPGPFPLQSHLAMVHFMDASDPGMEVRETSKAPMTLVLWTVKTELTNTCNWLHCGSLVRLIFRTALKTFLRTLAQETSCN